MSTPAVGHTYTVTVGDYPGEELTPFLLTALDSKTVTVTEVGLALDYDVPAVRVQVGKIRWDRPIQITLTREQRRMIGVDDNSDDVYTMFGDVFAHRQGEDPVLRGRQVECPHVDEHVIPASWLAFEGQAEAI